MDKQASDNLSLGSNLKIAFFHLGSGMADVLTTGVWNRVMVSDLGFAATPVSLLASLRYFLAPLGIWSGRMSDRHRIFGFRRLFWIWLGRLMMVISTLSLGYGTAQLAYHPGESSVGMWLLLTVSLLLFSLGNALSGSTFLALVYDRAPEHQRGRAVGIVWTFLLLGFTVGGIFFGALLPESENSALSFAPGDLLNLFVLAAAVFAGLWFFSLVGEERRQDIAIMQDDGEHTPSLLADLRLVWQDRHLRFFLMYLTGSMFFAFFQDLILEPFAGDVFGMEARQTNRFSAYWGSMAILGTVMFLWLSRRYAWLTMSRMSRMGVMILLVSFVMFGVSSLMELRWMVTPGLIVLGIGLGIWNVGTLGLMMDMSPVGRAGTFLGFWTLAVTFARGFGQAGGGIARDVSLSLTGTFALSYGSVFIVGAAGLAFALWALSQVDVPAFKKQQQASNPDAVDYDTATILAGSMD